MSGAEGEASDVESLADSQASTDNASFKSKLGALSASLGQLYGLFLLVCLIDLDWWLMFWWTIWLINNVYRECLYVDLFIKFTYAFKNYFKVLFIYLSRYILL